MHKVKNELQHQDAGRNDILYWADSHSTDINKIIIIIIIINPFTPDSAKSKSDTFSKIIKWGKSENNQHNGEVLLNSFQMNGHTLGFCPWNQKLEYFVSSKVWL